MGWLKKFFEKHYFILLDDSGRLVKVVKKPAYKVRKKWKVKIDNITYVISKKHRKVHFFVVGKVNELDVKLDDAKAFLKAEDYELLVENGLLETLTLKRLKFFEQFQTYMLILGALLVVLLIVVFMMQSQLNDMSKELHALKTAVEMGKQSIPNNATIVIP